MIQIARLTCLLAMAALPALAEEAAGQEPSAAEVAFAMLAAPLTTGTPGEPGSSQLTLIEGCKVAYHFDVEFDGVPLAGDATYDLTTLRLDRTKVKDRKDFTNINLRTEAQDTWSSQLSAAAEHAEGFKQIAPRAVCDDTICRDQVDDPAPTVTVIGDNHFARGEQAAAALDAFVAACKE